MQKYDVIIIGGACAGLTAGLYTGRRALKTLIISKDVGGQAAMTAEIENYPGAGLIGGPLLMKKFKEQAEQFGAEIKMGEVTSISRNKNFIVKSSAGEFETATVILAFGLEHRKLNAPGEKELAGRGVTYCATCDGPLFKNKIVGVVGGGNSAFDAAEYLSRLCKKVYLFARRDEFRADQVLVDEVKAAKNVEILTKTEVKDIIGENRLASVTLREPQGGTRDMKLDGLFIEIGYEPKTEMIKDLIKLDERGFVIVDNEAKTSTPGIFAAGDITSAPFKQAVISAGEGAKAGLSAARFIQQTKNINEDRPDWTKRKK